MRIPRCENVLELPDRWREHTLRCARASIIGAASRTREGGHGLITNARSRKWLTGRDHGGMFAAIFGRPLPLSTAAAAVRAGSIPMNDSASFRSSLARHQQMANAIRALAMDAVEAAKSGHPGMPMGAADIATVLFANFLKFDPQHPDWPDRDRFVLSAGHGSMLLYSLLHLTGYPAMTIEELRRFRQLGSRTAGHPEYGLAPGIETTTGPLGQGLANAVGMALADRLLNARFGDALVDHYTYVIAGDGCLMEGISHEAISLAGHLRLGKLIVLWDDNRVSIDGSTDLAVADDQLARFRACGWDVQAVDGTSRARSTARWLALKRRSSRPLSPVEPPLAMAPRPRRERRRRTARHSASRRSKAPGRRWAGPIHPSRSPKRSSPRGARSACAARTNIDAGAALSRCGNPLSGLNSRALWRGGCPRTGRRRRSR